MSIAVRVPATSANCGPGFDSLGLALAMYNTFTFTPMEGADTYSYTFQGLGADILEQENPEDNLIGESMKKLFAVVGEEGVFGRIDVSIAIPPARGLGSSSTAIVAGLMLANRLVKKPLSKEAMLELANEMEGHPDNVAPALLGDLICAVQDGAAGLCYGKISVPDSLRFAVVVPDVLVSTEYARSVLPTQIAHKKAVANVGRAALLVTALQQNKPELLAVALEDMLHVPYRKELIPCCDEVFAAAREAGAYGSTISGSGSTLIAYCNESTAHQVVEAMVQVFLRNGIECIGKVLTADANGADYI